MYMKETTDFDILCSESEPPEKNEKVEVVMELEVNGFPFYRLKFVNREGYQFFDLARPLMKYYVEQGFLVEYSPDMILDDHRGMIYNPIDKIWKWL